MRILVVTGIFPPDIGGPASYVPRISRSLIENGHQVDVVTLADRGVLDRPLDYPFTVHRIERQMGRVRRMLRSISTILEIAGRADVIYANGLVLEAVLAARLARKPIVVKVVGDTIWERARNAGRRENLDVFQTARLPLRWRLMRALQNIYMRHVNGVITPSVYLKSVVAGWGVNPIKIDVVYNALPASDVGDGNTTDVDVVSVGRLVPWKGFDELISVVAANGWSLRIVGDGPLRETLAERARAERADVDFAGHVSQSEVHSLLRRARVFVLNSSYEGLPHIVLEAMACRVPVVATRAGGTPEVVLNGKTGLLVPVGDRKGLQAAIADMLTNDALRSRYVANAKERLEARFSFQRMIRETEAVLHAMANVR